MSNIFQLIWLVLSLVTTSIEANAIHGIRNTNCFRNENAARADIFQRLEVDKSLCAEGLKARQSGGWSCGRGGCQKPTIKCVTQYLCETLPPAHTILRPKAPSPGLAVTQSPLTNGSQVPGTGQHSRSKHPGFLHGQKVEEARSKANFADAAREAREVIHAYKNAAKDVIDRDTLANATLILAQRCRKDDGVPDCERTMTDGYHLLELHEFPTGRNIQEAFGDYFLQRKKNDLAIHYYLLVYKAVSENDRCGVFSLQNLLNAYLAKDDQKNFKNYWKIALECNSKASEGKIEFHHDTAKNEVILRPKGALPASPRPKLLVGSKLKQVTFATPALLSEAVQLSVAKENLEREKFQKNAAETLKSDLTPAELAEFEKMFTGPKKSSKDEERDFSRILAKDPALADEMRKKHIKSLEKVRIGMPRSEVFSALTKPDTENKEHRTATFWLIAGAYLDPKRVPTQASAYVRFDMQFDEVDRLTYIEITMAREKWTVGKLPKLPASTMPLPTARPTTTLKPLGVKAADPSDSILDFRTIKFSGIRCYKRSQIPSHILSAAPASNDETTGLMFLQGTQRGNFPNGVYLSKQEWEKLLGRKENGFMDTAVFGIVVCQPL